MTSLFLSYRVSRRETDLHSANFSPENDRQANVKDEEIDFIISSLQNLPSSQSQNARRNPFKRASHNTETTNSALPSHEDHRFGSRSSLNYLVTNKDQRVNSMPRKLVRSRERQNAGNHRTVSPFSDQGRSFVNNSDEAQISCNSNPHWPYSLRRNSANAVQNFESAETFCEHPESKIRSHEISFCGPSNTADTPSEICIGKFCWEFWFAPFW